MKLIVLINISEKWNIIITIQIDLTLFIDNEKFKPLYNYKFRLV